MNLKGFKDKKTFSIMAIGSVAFLILSYFLYNHKAVAPEKQDVAQIDESGALDLVMLNLAVNYINASKEKFAAIDAEDDKGRFYYVFFYNHNDSLYMDFGSSFSLGNKPVKGYTHIGEDLFVCIEESGTEQQKLIDINKLSTFDSLFVTSLSSKEIRDTSAIFVRRYSLFDTHPKLVFEGVVDLL